MTTPQHLRLTPEEIRTLTKEAGGSYRGQFDLHQMCTSELQRFIELATELRAKKDAAYRDALINSLEG